MSAFVGFPAGKTRFTPLPDLFFTELLTQIRDLDELKLLLYVFYYLNRQRGYPRYMTLAELEAEGLLLSALKHGDDDPGETLIERLRAAVAACVARGALLQIEISDESGATVYLFANTEQGRQAVDEVRNGELVLERRGAVHEPRIERPRPTIFELYEQNIGLLQPLLAEELQEAERDYPPEWIEDAFLIAAENNARSWRYINAILQRWAAEGKDDRTPSSRLARRQSRIRRARR
jgi:DnaD/phage-associated family protein